MRVIDESSAKRRGWDAIIASLVVLSCVIVPYQLAFRRSVDLQGSVLVYLIDVFFLIDVFLNFRTSFRAGGTVISDRRSVVRRYLRGNFAIDVLASIPFDALLLSWSDIEFGSVSVVLFARLLRLFRIWRLLRVFQVWEAESWSNSGYLRIGKFFLTVLLLVHWIACAWFLVPCMEGFPEDSWCALENVHTASSETQYIRSLYWAITTMTTVGFGDITPNRNIEYVFSMVVMLLGASVYAFIIANIASLVSNLNADRSRFWSKAEAVHQYLRSRGVSAELNDHIRGYYEYIWARRRGLEEDDFFSDLPRPIRIAILHHLTKEFVDRVPLLRHCSPALRDVLLLELQPQVFAPGDYVAREGEIGNEIFFVASGQLEIVTEEASATHGTFESGGYFGDLSLLLREKRTASVRASSYCELFVLNRATFDRIKSEYEEFHDVLRKVSSERTQQVADLLLAGLVL